MISQSRHRPKIATFQDWKNAQRVLEKKEKEAAWVPKHINDQNALFSNKVPCKKAMRKPGQAAIVSINIFNLASTFKPHCIRNNYSTRNSSLFSQDQSQNQWRSSSKKVRQYPQSKQILRNKCFKSAAKTNANQSSIDLSWSEEPLKGSKLNESMRLSRGQFNEEKKIFQGKKRVGNLFNYSSIEL